MAGGLFSSLYGRNGQGLYKAMYSQGGAAHQVKRFESRLGQAEEDDEEDDEEDETPSAPSAPGKPFFSREFAGLPLWLLGVCFLGFSYAYRRKAKASGISK